MSGRQEMRGAEAGGFALDVVYDGSGRACTVSVRSARPLSIARALIGQSPADALTLVPLLFPLCGLAQSTAAVLALEQALALAPGPGEAARRRLLVLGEQAVSHAWRVVIDWAPLLGERGPLDLLRRVRQAVARLNDALTPDGRWTSPGGTLPVIDHPRAAAAVTELGGLLPELLFGAETAPPVDLDTLQRWSWEGASVPARLIDAVGQMGLSGWGGHDLPLLGTPSVAWFGGQLAADPGFGAQPVAATGQPAEAGPLAAARALPLLQAVTAAHGNGVLARFVAQIYDGAALGGRMRAALAGLAAEAGSEDPAAVASPGQGSDQEPGQGAGIAETTRGPVAHWTRIADGLVADWRFVAPSEWNFHPAGPVVRAATLAPAAVDPAGALRLLVAAYDPCAPCRVQVRESADA